MARVSGGDPRLPHRLPCPALLWRVGQGGGVRKVRGRWSRGQGSLLWRRHGRGGGLGGEESGMWCQTTPVPNSPRGERGSEVVCAAGLADRNCKVLGCILGAASFSLPCVLTVSGRAAVKHMRLIAVFAGLARAGRFWVSPFAMGRWIYGGVGRYTAQYWGPAVGHPSRGSLVPSWVGPSPWVPCVGSLPGAGGLGLGLGDLLACPEGTGPL